MRAAQAPGGLFERSILERLPRAALALVALVFLVAAAWSATIATPLLSAGDTAPAAGLEGAADAGNRGDLALYRRVAARVAAGESYYTAAAAEHRAGNYPLRPFVTVREPTLAWLGALAGPRALELAAIALLVGAAFAWRAALAERAGPPTRIAAALLAVLWGALAFAPGVWLIHEFWAGLLMTLSLALYRPRRLWPALAAAAAALAVRELALPFVLLWLAFAAAERRYREAAWVAALLAAFALGMALHAYSVGEQLRPGDAVSQGWRALLGPEPAIRGLVTLGPLRVLPAWAAGPLAVLPLLGWLGLRGRPGWFAAFLYAGYAAMIALFARPENFYWAQLMLPGYGIGLAFVPGALAGLARAMLGKP